MGGVRAIGVDVGGTKILSGLIDGDGQVLQTDRRPTPVDAEEIVRVIVQAVKALCEEDCSTIPVGVGYPGLVTHDGVARYGPNISLAEFPLGQQLNNHLGSSSVVVDNDASAATWAEFKVGAGRDVRDAMIMFTLGTGVGGGLIVNRQLYRGAHGFAGELGHMVIRAGGELGASGVNGELEAYSSGTAIARLGREAAAAGGYDGTSLEGSVPTGEEVSTSARGGVHASVEILRRIGESLGIAAAAMVNVLDPELIVVGGGAAAAGELILQPARDAMQRHVLGPNHRPEVPLVAAELGPAAGMIGAALLALQRTGA